MVRAAAVLSVVLAGATAARAGDDLVTWRPGNGTWYTLAAAANYTPSAATATQWGNQAAGDIPMMGDIDGDGTRDLILWRASTGTWYWLTSSTGYAAAAAGSRKWGSAGLGDVPVVGDFDRDGRADLTVWRASTATWYWLTSISGYALSGGAKWGSPGDVALVGSRFRTPTPVAAPTPTPTPPPTAAPPPPVTSPNG